MNMTYSIIQKSQLESANRLDAEYYQPEYLNLVNKLIKTQSYKSWGNIDGRFITGPFGSEFNVENYVADSNCRYVRGKDVKEFFILDNDNVYIPQKDFERLQKYSLMSGDILTSVVGTLGKSSIVQDSIIPAIFSCKSTVFRSKDINPYYFITYLNSYFGKSLLERCGRGHVQIGLNIDDLKSLFIFVPTIDPQKDIEKLIKCAEETQKNSEIFYKQAENLLLEELGLNDYKIEDDLSFVVNFSDVKSADRIDAEYFQPKYEFLKSKIKNNKYLFLADLVNDYSTGYPFKSDNYQESGIPLIRINNIRKGFIDLTDTAYLSEKDYLLSPKDAAKSTAPMAAALTSRPALGCSCTRFLTACPP